MTTLLFDLKHKTALITGGNGGIGLGLAKGIAKQGGNVCIWGRNKKKIRSLSMSYLISRALFILLLWMWLMKVR